MPFEQMRLLLLPLLLSLFLVGCAMPESEPAPPTAVAVAEEPVAEPQADADAALADDAARADESGDDTATAETEGDPVGDTAPILVPTQEPVADAGADAAEQVDWTRTASVDGDYYILGNPAAPLRLIDFSDFM